MTVALERRRRRVRNRNERPVAPLAVRQPHQALRVQALGEAKRIAVAVGNAVLNAAQARCIQIAKPACLYGRCLLREHAQPGDAGMTGEIDQNVDAIVAYGLCQLRF